MNPTPVSHVDRDNQSSVRRRLTTRDRLTELPDHIRLHILTFLPIKNAILTSLLSKSWINLWSHLSTLVFTLEPENDTFTEKAVHEFTSFVDMALLSHNSQHLDKFSVSFEYDIQHHEKQVHSWLRFAVNRNAKHIELIFEVPESADEPEAMCTIPSFLLQSDVLMSLSLKHCQLPACAGEIKCKSLTRLSLNICGLDDEPMAKLLLGCPVLERFELVDCYFENSFDFTIYHESLKELVIDGSMVSLGYDGAMLRISTPNLSWLSIEGFIMSHCQLSNLSSLLEAFFYLQYYTFTWPFVEDVQTNITNVLARLPNVKKLTFGSQCIEALSSLDATHTTFSVSSCRNLVLDTYLSKSQLRGIAWLLRSCPQLETFTLIICTTRSSSMKKYSATGPRTSFWKSQHSDEYFNCLDHLENVNVIGLYPNHPKMKYITELLQFILEHGKVLKKLCIKASQVDESMSDDYSILSSHIELSPMLLCFPRLSREVEIHFTVL